MEAALETMHREIDEIKTNVEKILLILESKGGIKGVRSILRSGFIDEEGRLSRYALKELAKARAAPSKKYIPHEEIEKWFGKSSGTKMRSKR